MKQRILWAIAPFLTALMLMSAPTPAAAQWAVVCVNCATEITAGMILNAIQTGFQQTQQKVTDSIKGAAEAQTTATSESSKVISDANTRTAANMKKLEVELETEPLDPCGVTAAARGGSEASNNRPAGSGRGAGGAGGGGGATATAGATKEMQEALKIGNGDKASPSPEVVAALATRGSCGTFAKGDLREGACKGAGYSTGVSSGFPNADIRAETLFDGPQNAADIAIGVNRKLTIKPGNSAEKMAVNAFIRNLETPTDLRTLTATELNTEAGRNYMALRDSYDASMSLATKPLRDQEALITANKTTLPILKQLMKSEDGRYVATELDRVYPNWKVDGISYAQLMNLEASRRYLNEDWHVRMAAANDKQLLAEQVQMQAFNGYLTVALLERIQQLGIIQGAVAGATVRSEKMPLLVAAHRAAKRPGG
ncbi:hypothetical protein [Polaromonas sp.]|uniref:hypothetical protein n=1 Tax=Polaromonas sp. TaxID=1869339 RepID=UPI00352B6413